MTPPRAMSGAGRTQGFTLVELLAAMIVLVIIVMAMSRIFTDTSSIFRRGVKNTESASTGRSALDFMAKELSSAIIDDTLYLKLDSDVYQTAISSFRSDRIAFVALNHKAEKRSDYFRDVQQVVYRVLPSYDATNVYRLGRDVWERFSYQGSSRPLDAYENPDWATKTAAGDMIADNVRNFEVWVYDLSGQRISDYDSRVHGPPLMADLYLEVLSEDDAKKAAILLDDSFNNRMTKRYHTRVHFNNRRGYGH